MVPAQLMMCLDSTGLVEEVFTAEIKKKIERMKRDFVYHNIGYRENYSLIRNSIFPLWPIWHLSDVTPTWNHLSSRAPLFC